MPRAMIVESFDRPLRMVETTAPELRHGEVLVRIEACGVCYSDVKTSRGLLPWSHELDLPHVPGHEICGRVIAKAPDAAIDIGRLVLVQHFAACGECPSCRGGNPTTCSIPTMFAGFRTPGGFQELLSVPAEQLVELPDDVDPVEAAPVACALATAYRAVVRQGAIRDDDRVLVIGLGGVGASALQIAASTATAMGIDISSEAVEGARRIGCRALSTEAADLDAISSMLGGAPTLIVDAVGATETLRLAADIAAAGARIVVIGYGVETHLNVPTLTVVGKELRYIGSRSASRRDFREAVEFFLAGKVTSSVSHVLPLAEANDALFALEDHTVSGRIVLDVSGARLAGRPNPQRRDNHVCT